MINSHAANVVTIRLRINAGRGGNVDDQVNLALRN